MLGDFKRVFEAFQNNGIEDPLSETFRFFNIVTGGALSNIDLAINPEEIDMAEIIEERKKGIPIEYLVGYAPFAGLLLHCTADTIIPTEYTKCLVDVAVRYLEERQKSEPQQVVADIGTGCGNIPILLARRIADVTIIGSDVSPDAVKIARKNIEKYGLGKRVSLVCGDLVEPFLSLGYAENLDVVLCNPPYIPTMSIEKMLPEISVHQPKLALDGGPYGISFYQRLINEAVRILKPGGMLIFEIGEGQEKLVSRTLERHEHYEGIEYHEDHENIVRVLSARKKK